MIGREDPFLEIAHVTLDWLKVQLRQRVSESVMEQADMAFVREELLRVFTFELRTRVLAESLPPDVVRERKTFRFNVPASGWQQWKASHGAKLPAWFLRRWPVRFVEHVHTAEITVDLRRFWAYPDAKARAFRTELGEPIRLAYVAEQSVDWREWIADGDAS